MAEAVNEDSLTKAKHPDAIRLYIPPRYLVLTCGAALTGLSIGLIRGARTASLRFLAENAHRPPRTVQGWYFYKKTKNYKMMWGGLKEGGADALKLGIVGLGWAGLEDGMERLGLGDAKEIGAGLGTAGMFSVIYRLPLAMARRALVLGVMVGSITSGLRWGQERLRVTSSIHLNSRTEDDEGSRTQTITANDTGSNAGQVR